MKKVLILDGSDKERPLLQQLICKCTHETFIVFRGVDSGKAIGLSVCCKECSRILFVTFERPDGTMEIRIPPTDVFKDSFLRHIEEVGIEKATIPVSDEVADILSRFFF